MIVKKICDDAVRYFFFNASAFRLQRFKQTIKYNAFYLRNFEPKQFITLTYSPESYKKFGQYEVAKPGQDFRVFMNRLKSYMRKREMALPSYFRCVENGGKNGRIHFHVVLDQLFNVHRIRNWWRHGLVHSECVTGDSRKMINYLSKYFTKDRDYDDGDDESEFDKGIPSYPIYFRAIRGQRFSRSRSLLRIPKGYNLIFKKQMIDDEHFDMIYALKESKYRDWLTTDVRISISGQCKYISKNIEDMKDNMDLEQFSQMQVFFSLNHCDKRMSQSYIRVSDVDMMLLDCALADRALRNDRYDPCYEDWRSLELRYASQVHYRDEKYALSDLCAVLNQYHDNCYVPSDFQKV